MIPDIVTKDGDFISSSHNYTLRISKRFDSEYELIYRRRDITVPLCRGAISACSEMLWQTVSAIRGSLPKHEVPKLVSLGAEIPETCIPSCEACETKQERIQQLQKTIQVLDAMVKNPKGADYWNPLGD